MVFWVSGNYRTPTADAARTAHERERYQHSLSRFFERVDLLFYAAMAAFAACVGILVLG